LEEIGIVLNENAGKRQGKKDRAKISEEFSSRNLSHRILTTQYQGHAVLLTQQLIQEGYRKIVGVGGDGTLNEILNGIMKQNLVPASKFTLGIIPIGSGNDWGRTMLVPGDYSGAVDLIAKDQTYIQDIGLVSSIANSADQRYFINVAGGGFDAFVARKTNSLKQNGKGSALTYLYALLGSMFSYQSSYTKLDIDGAMFSDLLLSFSVGIGKYNGGGMKQLPDAIVDDGLLNITVIRHLKVLKMMKNVSKLYDGSHITMPEVSTFTCKSVKISSERDVLIETDGENCGNAPVEISIIPKAIRVYSGLGAQ
jgi:diacylglycerol kinase (ATP)